jgi:hypothetical protein
MRVNRKNNTNLRKHVTQSQTNICVLKVRHMKDTFVKTDFKVTGFKCLNVIFDDSDLVSMRVSFRIQEQVINSCLLLSFSTFNDLLRFSGEAGETLQLKVSDKLLGNECSPYIIDLKEGPLVFTCCALEISYLIEGDQSCFSVEEVAPLSFLQQAKNLRNNIKDFTHVQLQQDKMLNHALQEMATMYRYYRGLLELNLSEEHAREKAGLQNDKLFKIAYHAAKKI